MTAATRKEPSLNYEDQKMLATNGDTQVRRALALREDVRPELLYLMAEDASAEVRRAIADNAATPSHAYARLARDGDGEVRALLAQRVAKAMPNADTASLARARARATEALEILAQDQLKRVRQVLAEALKDRIDAPPTVINRLARDVEIDVAGPILRFSPVLSDDDLISIVRAGAASPALTAISHRAGVASGVADAIAATEDVAAVAALLGNPSAQIREETLDRLIDAAPRFEAWHKPMAMRPTLTASAIRRMAGFVAESVLEGLRQRKDLDEATLMSVESTLRKKLDAASDAMPERVAEPVPPARAAESDAAFDEACQAEEARTLHREGKLDEDTVSDALLDRRWRFVVVALAARSNLSEAVVEKIITARSGPGLTALAWKAELSPECAVQLQVHMGKLSPSSVLAPPKPSVYPLKPEDMSWQIEFFQTLAPAAARA
jgi:uncharacterized protein (DUF2336 family)